MSQCHSCERPARWGQPTCGPCDAIEQHERVCDGEIVARVVRVTTLGNLYAWRCERETCDFCLPSAAPEVTEREAADRAYAAR